LELDSHLVLGAVRVEPPLTDDHFARGQGVLICLVIHGYDKLKEKKWGHLMVVPDTNIICKSS
jgi:hypothetical protein